MSEVRDSRNSVRKLCWGAAAFGIALSIFANQGAGLVFIAIAVASYAYATWEDKNSETRNRTEDLEDTLKAQNRRISQLEDAAQKKERY
jgi:hypothetical protein